MNRAHIDGTGAGKASLKSTLTGFILSIILTGIAFGLVMSRATSGSVTLAGILGAAVLQILVHLHYFLHLDTSSEMRWNVFAALFTLLIMILFVGGSIWIMHSLHYRLM